MHKKIIYQNLRWFYTPLFGDAVRKKVLADLNWANCMGTALLKSDDI